MIHRWSFEDAVTDVVTVLFENEEYFPFHVELISSILSEELSYSKMNKAFDAVCSLKSIPGLYLSEKAKIARCNILNVVGKNQIILYSKFSN